MSPSWMTRMPAPLIPLFSESPTKADDVSMSPRKNTSFGSWREPRFTVVFVPQPLVSVGVLVRPDAAPVKTIGHPMVLCRMVVDGLLATRSTNLSMTVGFSEASAATVSVPVVYAPVVWLLPLTALCLAGVLSPFFTFVSKATPRFVWVPGWAAMPYFIGLAVVFQFDAVSQAEPMLAHA